MATILRSKGSSPLRQAFMHLILYSKPGCHLCEGLQEKLEQIQTLPIRLEIRDITTRDDWFQAYQYEIPVLFLVREHQPGTEGQQDAQPTVEHLAQSQPSVSNPPSLTPLPRLSPRATVYQVEQMLQKYLLENETE